MIPARIRTVLDHLQRRERHIALSWVAARGVACLAGLLFLACGIDFVVDLWQDTPESLRRLLQIALLGTVFLGLGAVLRVMLHRRSEEELALQIEQQIPLGHRLISAVQLNRPGAKIEGMSRELIAALTQQMEEEADKIDLQKVCNSRKVQQARILLAAVAFAGILLYLLAPQTWNALLLRLLGDDRPIPRSLALETITPEVWPAGEEGELRLQVLGKLPSPEMIGLVRIDPESGSSFRLALHLEHGNIYHARVPPGEVPFSYRAWLGDGRLRSKSQVRYEPRPVIQAFQATILLPSALLGTRASGEAYEETQSGGDIEFRLLGCRARLTLTAQVPLASGEIIVHGKQTRRVPLTLDPNPRKATGLFELLPEDQSYQLVIRDRHGFENRDPPRRAIRKLPLEPPIVTLLPETFWKEGDAGPPEDREVEGIPILLGERFPVAYEARARYGLSHAQLRYRVLPKSSKVEEESGNVDPSRFLPLPLGPARGAQQPISAKAREEFWTKPTASDEILPDREGGGRYDFTIAGIPDGQGGRIDLQEGDRLQFYIEVFSKADPEGQPGRSAIREKEVVDVKAYLSWLQRKEDLKERTRYLEEQQRATRPESTDR